MTVSNIVCQSCEKTIGEELSVLKEVESVSVELNSGLVTIVGNDKLSQEKIEGKLNALGYPIRVKAKKKWTLVLWAIGALLILRFLSSNQGLVELVDLSKQQSYGIVFLVGILTSFHCIFMCGGIAMSQSITNKDTHSTMMASLTYNIGRVISYTIIGGIVGGIGSLVMVSDQFRGAITIGAGLFMILFGLKFLGVVKLPKLPSKKSVIKLETDKDKYHNNFVVGLLNGFMPCGPLQTIQLYALSTGSFVVGATSMFVFALGTVPLMLGVGLFTSKINRTHGARLLKVSAIAVMLLGMVMFNRGLSLYGVSLPGVSVLGNNTQQLASNELILSADGYQEVTLVVTGRDYKFEETELRAGIPVRINIDIQGVSRCSNPLIIPKYNITKDLLREDPIIEFTPEEIGSLKITCWMGMITTNIEVKSADESI